MFRFGHINSELVLTGPKADLIQVGLQIPYRKSMQLEERYRTASSAYNIHLLWISRLMMSLIYILNRIGPNTEPWGTPYVTFSGGEVAPFALTDCNLFFK